MNAHERAGFVLFMLVAVSIPAAAQESPPPPAESGFTVGIGAGGSSENYWLGGQLGFHRPSRDWLIRGGLIWGFELFDEDDAIVGVAVLRGWRWDSPDSATWRRLAVGLGVDYAEVYTEDESGNCGLFGCSQTLDERTGVGLALQGDFGFDLGGVAGLSLTGQGSLNTARTWFAAGVMLTLGPTSMNR